MSNLPYLESVSRCLASHIDILNHIGEQLCNERDHPTLASLSRTNQPFNQVFTPLLYRNLVFKRINSISRFANHFEKKDPEVLVRCYQDLVGSNSELGITKSLIAEEKLSEPGNVRQGQAEDRDSGAELVPSPARAFRTWQHIQSLEIDHEMLAQDAKGWSIAAMACARQGGILFPALKRIIIRTSLFDSSASEERDMEATELRTSLAEVLGEACRPLYICVDLHEQTYLSDKQSAYHRPRRSTWHELSAKFTTLKALIIHQLNDVGTPPALPKTFYRFDWEPEPFDLKPLNEDGDQVIRYHSSDLVMLWLTLRLYMGERTQSIEAPERLKYWISQKVSVAVWADLSEGTATGCREDVLNRYMGHFKFIPAGESRPNCQACGKEMY